ncbi:MAG: FAD-dependent oxidoreductase [Gammaproteobacteria bacterium]|nr:FAD-dependent oxidoreductase [Gammaproteobacteria bacterium]
MPVSFPKLFEPITIRDLIIKNRIFSPAHGTSFSRGGLVTDELVAYHQARARGGAGLIVLEGMGFDPTFGFPDLYLYAGTDACIPGFARLAEACHAHDCKVFAQLFHAGRAVRASHDGSRPATYSASDIPDERYRVVPAPMTSQIVRDVINAYGDAAARFEQAGLDGVEVLASMGYLISQFLNPRVNIRDDEFGGSLDNRLRFLREIIADIRSKTGPNMVVGIRISGDEMTEGGLTADEAIEICEAIDGDGEIDYFSVIAGSSASPAGWIHVFPPMAVEHAYVAPIAASIKAKVSRPVLVAGRVNQPQLAEAIIASGQADMCGAARALICDPEFANKARDGRADDIRACIGCNQACVGHRLAHHGISCIQHPETGRELTYGELKPAERPLDVMVVGAGPAGMKAASVAAERGHKVTLYEQSAQLGGQALLAQLLPGRAEFGGIVTNLVREIELAGVEVKKNLKVTADLVRSLAPDVVMLATGATPRMPKLEGADEAHVVDAWSVISGEANIGSSVVIADWRCDWVGLGLAEKLARDGCHVRLLSGGIVAGEAIQGIVRDQWIGELHKLGVEMIPYARLFGADRDTAYFQHMTSGEAVICENVDTLVVCYALRAETDLGPKLNGFDGKIQMIGDCLSPRTAEEAVLEGLKAGSEL